MKIYAALRRLLLIPLTALCVNGCAEPDSQPDAPPPPPPQSRAAKTYDYTHALRPGTKEKLARKLVIALIRFEEDRPVEGVPFGPDPKDAALQQKTPIDMNLRSRAMLKHELMESECFVLVERERILDLLRELEFGQTKFVQKEGTAPVGEILGVGYLLEASIGLNQDRTFKDTIGPPPSYKDGEPTLAERIFSPSVAAEKRRLTELARYRRQQLIQRKMEAENRVGVYLSLYSVRTSEIAAEAFGIGGNSLEALRDAVEDLCDKCRDIQNPPRITAMTGDEVYIDVGLEEGAQSGRRYRYLASDEPIRGAGGQQLATHTEEGGELEIVRVERLVSIAKVTREVQPPRVGARIEPLD